MMFPEDEKEEMYELACVTYKEWMANIYANISSAFVANDSEPANDHYGINNIENDFARALYLSGEVSQFSDSIGSCDLSDDPCDLFDKPIMTTMDHI